MSNRHHNHGPIILDIHPDDRMKYAAWNLRDFLQGVRGLRPDQIGIYAIILNLLYDTMGQLKDDDRFVAGHCQCEIRYYRKLRQSLIDAGKIFEADGYLYNNRAMAEIAKFCETARRKREAAALREQQKREAIDLREQQARDASGKTTSRAPDARLTRASQAPDAHGAGAREVVDDCLSGSEKDGKHNKINDSTTTAVVTAVPVLSTYKERERETYKKEEPPNPPLQGGSPPQETFELVPQDQPPPDDIAAHFEVWWQAFPESVRKHAKGECMALFREAITGKRRPGAKKLAAKILEHGTATAEQLIAAVRAYAATKPDPQFVPTPATWLNQGRWLDNPKPGEAGIDQPWWRNPDKVAGMTLDRWRKGIEKFGTGHWNARELGPPPGTPTCVVSQDVVRELRLTEIYTPHGLRRAEA